MKKKFEFLGEMSKNPQGKALMFFGGYLILFVVIFLIIATSNSSSSTATDYEKGIPYSFNTGLLETHNYHYTYKITLDDDVSVVDGDRYEDKEVFTYKDKKYYKEKNDFYTYGDKSMKIETPYKFSDFLDIEKVIGLVEFATYESSTNYESGKTNYNFLISTNTINKVFSNIDSDFMEEPNTIIISIDTNKQVNKASLNLDSYCVMNKLCNKSLRIDLDFSKFGEIKEIK